MYLVVRDPLWLPMAYNPFQTFLESRLNNQLSRRERLFRRDAETSTRDARATQTETFPTISPDSPATAGRDRRCARQWVSRLNDRRRTFPTARPNYRCNAVSSLPGSWDKLASQIAYRHDATRSDAANATGNLPMVAPEFPTLASSLPSAICAREN